MLHIALPGQHGRPAAGEVLSTCRRSGHSPRARRLAQGYLLPILDRDHSRGLGWRRLRTGTCPRRAVPDWYSVRIVARARAYGFEPAGADVRAVGACGRAGRPAAGVARLPGGAGAAIEIAIDSRLLFSSRIIMEIRPILST